MSSYTITIHNNIILYRYIYIYIYIHLNILYVYINGYYSVCVSSPCLVRHIPESPRWLLVSGNDQEALNVLASIAQGNGTTMPASCELKKTSDSSGGREVASIRDLFTGKNIRHRTLVLCLVW